MNYGYGEWIVTIIIGFCLGFIFITTFVPLNFVLNDEGTHTGYITAIEKHGAFIKKYSVYVKTDNSSSQEDEYCVPADKKDLIAQLRVASEHRLPVVLFYYDKLTTGLWNSACAGDEIFKFTVRK